jgi:hypothetical protein
LTNWYCALQFGQLNGVGLSLMARQFADNHYQAQGCRIPQHNIAHLRTRSPYNW